MIMVRVGYKYTFTNKLEINISQKCSFFVIFGAL